MFWRIEYFIRDFWESHHLGGNNLRVLDVGSRNINGSVKDGIADYGEFIGVDFIEGRDVDIVMNAHDLLNHFKEESFDVVFCCETFEHDDKFWVTLENMRKLTKPGGYMFISVPGLYFIKHDYPSDYYRFTKEAVATFFEGFEDIKIFEHTDPNDDPKKPNTSIMAYGRKPV